MAVTSGFFNSINGDRRYNAEQMSAIFDGVINDGILANIGTAFTVTSTGGNSVEIGVGRAWFNSTWVYNDAVLPMTLEDADLILDRIDAIVIEINHTDEVRAGTIKVVKGTPSSTPTNPTMISTEDVHQYPLAYVYREGDSTSFDQADITSMIGTSSAPYVTGILQVQNIDNIVAQWQQQWINWFAAEQTEGEAAKTALINAWNEWYAGETSGDEAEFTSWLTQMKADFIDWYNNLQAVLEPDTATNLANAITELQSRFDDLAMYRSVAEELEDSSAPTETILDSYGNPILGQTKFALPGEISEDSLFGSIPFDATNAEGGEGYQIGDTITTARTDLDDAWALCNGASLNREEYPVLSSLISDNPVYNNPSSSTIANFTGTNTSLPYISKPAFSSTHCAVAVDDGSKIVVYYKSLSAGASTVWSSKTIHTPADGYDITGSPSRHMVVFDFINGRFMVVLCERTTTLGEGAFAQHILLYHTSGGNPSGTWTKRTVYQTYAFTQTYAYFCKVNNIKHVNGQYIICGAEGTQDRDGDNDDTSPMIWYSSNLTSWSDEKLKDYQGNYNREGVRDIVYADGKYWAVGELYDTGTIGLAYCSALNGTWSYNANTSGQASNSRIVYNEKEKVYVKLNGSASLSYAINASGTWTSLDMRDEFDFDGTDTTDDVYIQAISVNDEGDYIFAGIYCDSTTSTVHYRIIASKSIHGPWTGKELHSHSYYASETSVDMSDFWISNSFYGVTLKTVYNDSRYRRLLLEQWKRSDIVLPEISWSGSLYTYIKIRSD